MEPLRLVLRASRRRTLSPSTWSQFGFFYIPEFTKILMGIPMRLSSVTLKTDWYIFDITAKEYHYQLEKMTSVKKNKTKNSHDLIVILSIGTDHPGKSLKKEVVKLVYSLLHHYNFLRWTIYKGCRKTCPCLRHRQHQQICNEETIGRTRIYLGQIS